MTACHRKDACFVALAGKGNAMSRLPVAVSSTGAAEDEAFGEEPTLAADLCEAFGAWLEPELARLDARFAAFVTPDSARKAIFQARSPHKETK
jgi:hypothetical protein